MLRIIEKKVRKEVYFSDLKPGDIFIGNSAGSVYIKLDSSIHTNAADMTGYRACLFDSGAIVIPVEATLTVER